MQESNQNPDFMSENFAKIYCINKVFTYISTSVKYLATKGQNLSSQRRRHHIAPEPLAATHMCTGLHCSLRLQVCEGALHTLINTFKFGFLICVAEFRNHSRPI